MCIRWNAVPASIEETRIMVVALLCSVSVTVKSERVGEVEMKRKRETTVRPATDDIIRVNCKITHRN